MKNPCYEKSKQLPAKPGVYRFLDANHKIIYVGKAKDLKKRVSNYFRSSLVDRKTIALMEKAVDFEITVTENENQALLLESNLIKEFHPKYNVLLRDDKSYPYLFLSTEQDFPRLDYYRGIKREKGRYFGPYPNAGSVRDNLAFIQKLFKLRQCRDTFFNHRSRPCLQYQINRCTAPCVNLVSREKYQEQVQEAIDFLEGKSQSVIDSVMHRMELAAENRVYEEAAECRDLLIRLRKLQAEQNVISEHGNVDVFGVAEKMGQVAVAVVSIRQGQMIGHKTYLPNLPANTTLEEALCAFIPQYYCNPIRSSQKIDRIITSHTMSDRLWIQDALQELLRTKIQLIDRKMDRYREWQSIAVTNAEEELKRHQTEKETILNKLEMLQKILHFPVMPERIECFDISHTAGEATKASCVVFGASGAMRKLYRQYSIENITPGDDYAAMRQVLTRRYTHLKKNNLSLPDLIIVDGGQGQLQQAIDVLESLQISGVTLMGIAKGVERKKGCERIFIAGHAAEMTLSPDDPVLHLLQFIQDEAHRFAITAHRKKRAKNRLQSKLDTIVGVGKKRKMDLLIHFGGLQELKKASAAEIAKVKGVSLTLAKEIYTALHE